jgi:hypothetical protein
MVPDVRYAALAVLLVIAGCSGGATGEQGTTRAAEPAATTAPAPTTAPRAPVSDVRVPLLPPGGQSHQVGAIGALEVEGPCLYLREPQGTRTLPAFATAGTRWNASQGWLEVGERKFRPGETVRLSGSSVRALAPTLPWVQAPDPRCDASNAFIAYAITAGE